jgi:Transcription factor Tfb4
VFFGQPADKLNKWVDAAVTFVNAHLLLHANNSLAIVGAGRDQVNSLGFFAKLSTP